MPDDKFKLPGSSYAELSKIIQAYGTFDVPVKNEDVATTASVHSTIVSRNNAFLTQIGVLEGGRQKSLTDPGRGLAKALEHEMPDEIRMHWRRILEQSDFLQKVLAAIRIRRGMDSTTAQNHIAYTAGARKGAGSKTGTGTVLEILRAAEMIQEQDGRITVTADNQKSEKTSKMSIVRETEPDNVSPLPLANVRVRGGETPLPISVTIQIEAKPSELAELGSRLRQLIQEVRIADDSESE